MKMSVTYTAFAVICVLFANVSGASVSSSQQLTEVTEDVSTHKNIGLLNQDICGPHSQDKIADDSTKTGIFDFPWLALIAYSGSTGNESKFRCSGSIVNERYVLTAAHCVAFVPGGDKPISVRLGEHNLDTEIDCEKDVNGEKKCSPAPQDIDVEEVISHPDYTNASKFVNDIALLRLSKAADFSKDAVKPVCLPIGLPQQTKNFDGMQLEISGWVGVGRPDSSSVLLKNKIRGVSHEQCAEDFKDHLSISPVSQLCAGGDAGDTCVGDGAGPLVSYEAVQDRMAAVQEGILVGGTYRCNYQSIPTVFTRVGHFMKWILDTMKS